MITVFSEFIFSLSNKVKLNFRNHNFKFPNLTFVLFRHYYTNPEVLRFILVEKIIAENIRFLCKTSTMLISRLQLSRLKSQLRHILSYMTYIFVSLTGSRTEPVMLNANSQPWRLRYVTTVGSKLIASFHANDCRVCHSKQTQGFLLFLTCAFGLAEAKKRHNLLHL